MISNLRGVLFQALFLTVLTVHTAAVYRVLLLHAIHHTRQYCHCVTNKPTYHTTYSEDESILSPDIMQCLAMSTYTSVCSITESPELVSLLQWDTWLDSPLGWPRCPGRGSTERTQRGEISGEAPAAGLAHHQPPHCSVHSRAGNDPSRSFKVHNHREGLY